MAASTSSSFSSDVEEVPLVDVSFKHTDGATHFIAATASSLHVFACKRVLELVDNIRFDAAEVTCAAMQNLSELVYATHSPNADTVYFWNELRGRGARSMRSLCGEVRRVRRLGDYTLVAGKESAVLYAVDVQRENEVATGPNALGLCAMARPEATLVYALPGPERCTVQIRRRGRAGSVNLHAHTSGLACIALSDDGRLLATAGTRGTLLRIFDTTTGNMLHELRRGSDRASIHCIAFSPDSKWLAVSSDKGTVHIFSVSVSPTSSWPDDDADYGPFHVVPLSPPAPVAKPNLQESSSSSFSFLKAYLPVPGYQLRSERSVAQLRGLRQGTRHEVAFGQGPNSVLVCGMDGSFRNCMFDPVKGGDMKVLQYYCNFMDI